MPGGKGLLRARGWRVVAGKYGYRVKIRVGKDTWDERRRNSRKGGRNGIPFRWMKRRVRKREEEQQRTGAI